MTQKRQPKIINEDELRARVDKYNANLAPSSGFWGIIPILWKMLIRNIKSLGSPDSIRSFNPQAKIMDEQVKKVEEPPSAMDRKDK